jgi:hypothetical protein
MLLSQHIIYKLNMGLIRGVPLKGFIRGVPLKGFIRGVPLKGLIRGVPLKGFIRGVPLPLKLNINSPDVTIKHGTVSIAKDGSINW